MNASSQFSWMQISSPLEHFSNRWKVRGPENREGPRKRNKRRHPPSDLCGGLTPMRPTWIPLPHYVDLHTAPQATLPFTIPRLHAETVPVGQGFWYQNRLIALTWQSRSSTRRLEFADPRRDTDSQELCRIKRDCVYLQGHTYLCDEFIHLHLLIQFISPWT